MYVVPPPHSAKMLESGQVFFSLSKGFVSHNIAEETSPEDYGAGLLVATHCGIVLDDGYVAEAWWPDWRVTPLGNRMHTRTPWIWTKTPAGQTPESAVEICRLARELEGTPYDMWGIMGFPLSDNDDKGDEPNPMHSVDKVFCSEGVAALIIATEKLRTVPLPESFKRVHTSWRSPEGLNKSPIWEEPPSLPA